MVVDELIVIENGEQKSVDSADNKIIDVISYGSTNYHFAKENEVANGICDNSVNEPIRDMQINGNSVQSNLPSEYQEYTSITDTNGVVYTRNGNIYPAKRNSDGVFGLYNTNINIFQTEV